MSDSEGERVVIVGAGQAGGDCAAALREFEYSGAITLIGEEATPPYSRPPLSKGYLRGEKTSEDLLIRSRSVYTDHRIDLRLGIEVVGIDRDRREVVLADGGAVRYSALVLAMGGRPRRHPDPALTTAENVHYLRSVRDVDRLRDRVTPGRQLAVIGGGYIGLEVAAVARALGMEVTVIEREPRLLARVTAAPLADHVEKMHAAAGVVVRTGVNVDEFEVVDRNVSRLSLSDGSAIAVDVCLVGIGLRLDTDLAVDAGLDVDDGVLVDEGLRTLSDPSIYAIGDLARYPVSGGGLRRLESIANATEHARNAAASIVGRGMKTPLPPWFWSDQYKAKIQMVGIAEPSDEVVVREADGIFQVFYLRAGVLSSAEIVSSPRDFAAAKKLVAARKRVDPAALRDPAIQLKAILAQSNSNILDH